MKRADAATGHSDGATHSGPAFDSAPIETQGGEILGRARQAPRQILGRRARRVQRRRRRAHLLLLLMLLMLLLVSLQRSARRTAYDSGAALVLAVRSARQVARIAPHQILHRS